MIEDAGKHNWLYTILLAIVVASGCIEYSKINRLTVKSVRSYFKNLEIGCPVNKIEKDLGLPPPTKTEGPAFDSPYWKYVYSPDQIFISFQAQINKGKKTRKDVFVYIGNSYVCSKKEYWQDLHQKDIRATLNQSDITSETVIEYFKGIEIGYPVFRIEADLNLSLPTKILLSDGRFSSWEFTYSVNGLMIFFNAQLDETLNHIEGPTHSGTFVYIGNLNVWSEKEYKNEEEYWRSLRQKKYSE